jgi:hypothetical protein
MRDISIKVIKQEQLFSKNKSFMYQSPTIYLNTGKIMIDLSIHNYFNSLLVLIKHWLETTIWGYCRTHSLKNNNNNNNS